MDSTLLATKYCVPPSRANLVARPRLLEKIQVAFQYSLALVSAPAGFGKTTLVSEWIRKIQPQTGTAWLSLEEADNDPARFWEYFIAAIRTCYPEAGKSALKLLQANQPLAIESTLTALINDLSELQKDFIMVMDDYHFIKAQPIHSGLTFLLEHLPPKMHLVIATRVDPSLPLTLFRGKGLLLEIGADDLRFTLKEASNLLLELGSPELSVQNLVDLNTRTEGWAVGLKMAFLSLKGERDILRFVTEFTGSQRYIMDYLMEEVLQKQSSVVQDFLLQTSVLEKLSGPLCDAICGSKNSGEMLLTLEKANLFIVPLDQSRQWYRYEHLFTDLLRHRLELALGKESVKEIRIKASHWHENQGLLEDAINYALAGRDWERAMRLLLIPEVQAPNWQSLTMYNWTRQIPVEVMYTNRDICMLHILCLWRLDEGEVAEIHLGYLEKTYLQDSQLQGKIAATRAGFAKQSGDSKLFEEYCKKALALLGTDNVSERGFVAMLLGGSYMNSNLLNEAEPLLTEGYVSMKRVGYIPGAAYPLVMLGGIEASRGKLHRAEKCYQNALETGGQNFIALYVAHLYLGNTYYVRNDLQRAAAEEEQAIELKGLPMCEAVEEAYIQLVAIRLAQGNIGAAEAAIERAESEFKKVKPVSGPIGESRSLIAGYRLAIAVAKEDTGAVSHWLDKFVEWDDRFLSNNCVIATHLLHQRWGQENEERLKAEYERFRQDGYWYYCILVRIEQAMVASDHEIALTYLTEALNLANPEEIIRPFVDYGMSLAPLIRKAISHGIEQNFAEKLLAIIEDEENQRQTRMGVKNLPRTVLELLSEREMEVLGLVIEGLSDRQIAGNLVIGLSTVKTHVHHILEKLGAHTRTQAAARAKELKLTI